MENAKERKGIQLERTRIKSRKIASEVIQRPVSQSQDWFSNMLGKVAVIVGGDTGISRQMAILFAREGASIVIAYSDNQITAEETKQKIEEEGGECLLIPGDVNDEKHCAKIIELTVARFGEFDILINDTAIHYPEESIESISSDDMNRTFRTDLLVSLARKLL